MEFKLNGETVESSSLESNPWEYVKLLGRGSFGTVSLWKNCKSDALTAVKTFEINSSSANPRLTQVMQNRWTKEVDIMKTLDCKYIVLLHNPVDSKLVEKVKSKLKSSQKGTNLLSPLCMEFCSGGDLRQQLRRPENISGFPESTVITILSHVASAISYLHERNIIHRDLKPENILLQYDHSNKVTYKLSDLGFAKSLSNDDKFCSTMLGTIQYLAPEIYEGKRYDKTVDYWSFGLIAYEVMCGFRPFLHGESYAQWMPIVEKKAKDVISVYRQFEDDKIKCSNKIQYHTHCSDIMKKCLETWLRVMLQLDPSARGKQITNEPSQTNEDPNVALTILTNILNTMFVTLTSVTKNLTFAIRSTTKVGKLESLVFEALNLLPKDQLILTESGARVSSEDIVSNFVQNGVKLYLIPMNEEIPRVKMNMPPILNSFLGSWENVKDPKKQRLVWASAIYFLQSEIRKLEDLKKINKVVSEWASSPSSIYEKLESVKSSVNKEMVSLNTLFDLEHCLDKIDGAVLFGPNRNPETDSTSQFTKRKQILQNKLDELALDEKLVEKIAAPVNICSLEEKYGDVIRHYEDWMNPESNRDDLCGFLVRDICQFMILRDDAADQFVKDLRKKLSNIKSANAKCSQLEKILDDITRLKTQLRSTRAKKQIHLVQLVLEKCGGHDANFIDSTFLPEPVYEAAMCSISTASNSRPGPVVKKSVEIKPSLSPEGEDLMQRSQTLQFESETLLNSTLGLMKTIQHETEAMGWEFLD